MNIFRSEKIKRIILLIGDIFCLYIALFLMLVLRFGWAVSDSVFSVHFQLFSFVFLVWLVVFYIGHFYEIGTIAKKWKFFKPLVETAVANFVLAIVFFYIYPTITPKINSKIP